MLSKGDLVTRGNSFISSNESVLYQKKDLFDILSIRENGWSETISIIDKLFPKQDSTETYNLDTDYKKIKMVNSFDIYFFDEMTGRLYHKDLSRLFVEKDELIAKTQLREMIDEDYRSVEEYLRSRTMNRLGNKKSLIREFHLLIELYSSRNNYENQSSLVWLMGSEAARQAVKTGITNDTEEYKILIHDILRKLIQDYSNVIGGLLIPQIDKYQTLENSHVFLFSRQEYIDMAIWCQRYYFSKFGKDNWNLNTALFLSNIRISKENIPVVVREAKLELKAFMEEHAEFFADRIINVNVQKNKILLSFVESFNPYQFFPIDGYEFTNWIDSCIADNNQRYLLRQIYNECRNGLVFSIENTTGHDSNLDLDLLASIIKEYEDNKHDKELLDLLKDKYSLDLNGIALTLHQSKEQVKQSIKRLVDKGMIEPRFTNTKEKMEPFEVGDFIALSQQEFDRISKSLLYTNNIFEIEQIDNKTNVFKYKVHGIEKWIEKEKIIAIPIDGIHDKDIYYDPIVMAPIVASGQPLPIHNVDYSYYMDSFKRSFRRYSNKKISYFELVNAANCQFVHEVQHYLNKEIGRCELKINHKINNNRIIIDKD